MSCQRSTTQAISEEIYTAVCDSSRLLGNDDSKRMIKSTDPTPLAALSADHREDIKLAASRMVPIKRRTFQATMAVKYCAGSPRQAEAVFGWSRQAVALG